MSKQIEFGGIEHDPAKVTPALVAAVYWLNYAAQELRDQLLSDAQRETLYSLMLSFSFESLGDTDGEVN